MAETPMDTTDASNSESQTVSSPPRDHSSLASRLSGVRTRSFLADFELLNEIGKGAFSTVKKCRRKLDDQMFAVKILNSNQRDPREEIEILFRFSAHHNTVSVEAVYENGSFVYIVMEYLAGGELLDYICKRQRLSEHESFAILRHVANTVAYLHQNQVVHRDLKPSNLVFAVQGLPETLNICDFGFAKQMRAENGLLMTPCYTTNFGAPEVLKMQGYHAACDMWSMGVLLFAMLSGKTPFAMTDHETPENIAQRIESGLQADIFQVDSSWVQRSDSVKDLIKSMLCVDPNARITLTGLFDHPWMRQMGLLPEFRPTDVVEEQSKQSISSMAIKVGTIIDAT
ncbi:Ribosomal protein S6 kinase alpha-1 [Cichlidogyrus casuarinus]|uniref:Ribosomal protein S6 kinase alpha-1 n=1 Tax=Cichlidogyrus casuarinus TaxID=1844966 RepID=A0ABD2Q8S6_9PLAT